MFVIHVIGGWPSSMPFYRELVRSRVLLQTFSSSVVGSDTCTSVRVFGGLHAALPSRNYFRLELRTRTPAY